MLVQRAVDLTYAWAADSFYQRFQKDTRQAGMINRRVLSQILQQNAETVYGKLNGFAQVPPFDSQAYKKQVPLTDFEDYEPYIEEIAAGKANVLTADPVLYFGLSSGTTGKQKRIPTTAYSRKIVNLSHMFQQQGLLRRALYSARRGGKGLMLMNMSGAGSTQPGINTEADGTAPGIPAGSGTAGGVKSMQKILPYFWTTPPEVLSIGDQAAANYLHLLFALTETNLTYMMAPFASGICQLFGVLEQKGPQLAKDLQEGRLDPNLKLEPRLRQILESKLKPNPGRGAELEQELAQGLKGIAPRLWPKISHVSAVAGGSFGIYTDKLKYYIGDTPIYSAIYAATEAMIGLAPEVNKPIYVVSPRAAYFEFIPIAESESIDPPTLDLDELQVGQSYEIVVTTYAGFYRYRLGDVVKAVGTYNASPIVEFLYRKGQLLNLTGEKTSETAVQEAIGQTVKSLNLVLEDYTVVLGLDTGTANYNFFLEVSENLGLAATGPARSDLAKLKSALESNLRQANPRYAAAVKGNKLSPCTVQLVQAGTFQKIRLELIRRGASPNQAKVPRLLKDPSLLNLLAENISRE